MKSNERRRKHTKMKPSRKYEAAAWRRNHGVAAAAAANCSMKKTES